MLEHCTSSNSLNLAPHFHPHSWVLQVQVVLSEPPVTELERCWDQGSPAQERSGNCRGWALHEVLAIACVGHFICWSFHVLDISCVGH